MAPQASLSILVPAFNEEERLEQTIDTIRQATSMTVADIEILVVDDGSTDRTGVIARRLQSEDPRIRLITNQTNLGLGGSYRRGLFEARKAYFIYIPGDNSWPALSLARIIGNLGRADVITSYATNPEVRLGYRRIVSTLYTQLVNLLFGFELKYYNGLTIYPVSFLRRHPPTTSGFGFQAQVLVYALAARLSVVEVGVPIEEDAGRRSRAITMRNIVSVGRTLVAMFWALRVRGVLRAVPAA